MSNFFKSFEFKIGIGVIGAIFALIIAFGSFYTVSEGTVGVISFLGKYDDEEKTAGLHWKLPIVESVDIQDVKMQTVNYKFDTAKEDTDTGDGVTQKPRITILDNKNLPIGLDVTVQYTPKAEQMSEILRTLGSNYYDKKLNPIVRDVVRDVASGYEAETISSKRQEIGQSINSRLAEEFEKLPFTLNNVALRDIVLPDVIRKKVEAVQEAKQEEQRLAMVEKQALVNKNIAIIDAEKAAQTRVIQAKGEAEAILAQAQAQAKANDLVSKSLTPNLIQQNWVERWNGVQPQYMLSSDANMLMSIK